jgi:hypothetical protein
MLLRLTEKLRKKMHVPPLYGFPLMGDPLFDWYAHVLTLQRAQHILVTNSASLLSVIFPGRGVTDAGAFMTRFFNALEDELSRLGLVAAFHDIIEPGAEQVWFAKTTDRRVLGTMMSMADDADFLLDSGTSICQLPEYFNNSHYKAIGRQKPRERFLQILSERERRRRSQEDSFLGSEQ